MNWHFTLQYTVKPPECYSYYSSDVTTESLHIGETNTPFLRPTCGLSHGESADKDSYIWAFGECKVHRHWPSSECAELLRHDMAPLQSQILAFIPSKPGLKKSHLFFPSNPRNNGVTVRTIPSLSIITNLLVNLDLVCSNTPAFEVQKLSHC